VRVILSAAGRAFIREFAVTFFVLASGIWTAPNYRQAAALAGAASLASLVAGVRAVRVFVPGLSTAIADLLNVPVTYSEILITAITTFLLGWLTLAEGVLSAPDLDGAKAAATAGLLAIGTALWRIVQAFLPPGEFASGGIATPPQPVPAAALPRPIPNARY